MQKQFDDYFGQRGAVLLTWAVIGVTLASPLADANPHIGAALALIILFSVLMGARLSANKKIMMRAVLPLSGLWVLARELEGLSSDPYAFSFLAHVVGLAFTCMILCAIYECIRASQVTSAVIAEALGQLSHHRDWVLAALLDTQ